MQTVVRLEIEERDVPLRDSYGLSFVRLSSYRTVLTHLTLSDGSILIGEVVPLPGYSVEDVASVLETVNRWSCDLIGLPVAAARRVVADCISSTPMAASLLLGALDRLTVDRRWSLSPEPVPVLVAASASDPDALDTVERAMSHGFRTVKVKLGEDVEADQRFLSRCAGRDRNSLPTLRFDANQGYDRNAAKAVVRALQRLPDNVVELLEQPLPVDDWEGTAAICASCTIPLMLDESICCLDDIERAARIGCAFIKLKLCKQGGLQEILKAARYARRLGLGVVFGNGVATDVVNDLELRLMARYPRLFAGASESVGFARLKGALLHSRLAVVDGYAIWRPEQNYVT